MDDATLAALDAAAHAGSAHPVDVIRLVDEVRELNDRIRTLEKTVALPDTARLVEFEAALRDHCGGTDAAEFVAVLRDPQVQVARTYYARTPHVSLEEAFAFLAVQLWRDKVTAVADLLDVSYTPAHGAPASYTEVAGVENATGDDTGEFVAMVESPVVTTPTPPSTGYADPTKVYVPLWDWKPGDPDVKLVDDGRANFPAPPWHTPTRFTNLAIPDLLSLLQEPTPLSASMRDEVNAELDRRGYPVCYGPAPTVSSKVPDGDAPTIVEK